MLRKFKSMSVKLTATLLALITLLSSLSGSLISYSDGNVGENADSTAGSGGGSDNAGTFLRSRSGFRIYIMDEDGNRISNTIDFVYDNPNEKYTKTGGGFVMYNTKVDPIDFKEYVRKTTYDIPDNYLRIQMSDIQGKFVPGSGEWPKSMKWTTGMESNGDEVKEWMMRNTKGSSINIGSGGTITVGGSGGSSGIGSTGGGSSSVVKPGNSNTSSIHQTTVASYANKLYNAVINAYWTQRDFGRSKAVARSAANNQGNILIGEAVNSELWSPEDITAFEKAHAKAMEVINGYVNGKEPIIAIPKLNISNTSLFSYAADTSNDPALSGTVDSDSDFNLRRILDLKDDNGNLSFKFINGKDATIDKNGKPSIVQTMSDNGYKVGIEALYWFIPAHIGNVNRYKGGWFYGTITNYGQFISITGYNDGGTSSNYATFVNKVGAVTMYTPYDIKDSEGNVIIHGVDGKFQYYSNATLANTTLGYDLHCYTFVQDNQAPKTPTYDSSLPNPAQPHPAPNPNTIPKTNLEKKLTIPEMNELTRKVEIVKVYEYEDLFGNRSHVTTTYRQQTPVRVDIEHEDEYKVIEYFTGTHPSSALVDIGIVSELTDKITWDFFLTAYSQFKVNVSASALNINSSLMKDKPKINGSITVNALNEHGYFDWDSVRTAKAGEVAKSIDLWSSCDCEKVTIDGQEIYKHQCDQVLYIRLLKKQEPPETHTFDKENYPKGDIPHPAPEPPEKPTSTTPGVTDEDLEKLFPYNVNIVKTYQTYNKETGEYTHDGTFVREENPGIVNIETEGTYELKNWFISNTYLNPQYETTWDEIISGAPIDGDSGTEEKRIELTEPTINLYVLLERTKDPVEDPDSPLTSEDLTESQLTKVSTTDSVPLNWSGYSFNANLAVAVKDHIYTVHKGCTHTCGSACEDGCVHECDGHCGDEPGWCQHMTRAKGDNYVFATFSILKNDSHETKVANPSAHDDFAGTMYGKGGQVAQSIKFEATVGDGGYSWSLGSNGLDANGIEYITTISRQSAGDKLNLALYKKDAMDSTSYDRVNTIHPGANQPSGKRLANGVTNTTIGYMIGHIAKDNVTASTCMPCGCPDHHNPEWDTKTVSYDKTSLSLSGAFNIFTYGGQADKVANVKPNPIKGFNVQYTTSGDVSKDSALYLGAQSSNLKFYPYIKMSYMITADNLSFSGYKAEPNEENSRTVYMLSDKSSTIIPTDSVEISWFNKTQADGGYGLQMTSTQWSVHNRATQGDDGWQGVNQVLPGGALYQLKTTDTESYIKTITYNTLVDDESRDWITVADPNKYTSNYVVTEVNKYLDELTNVIENYRIVQWVSKTIGADTAWENESTSVKIAGGGESLSNLGLSGKASTDSKYTLVNGTDAQGVTEADIDIEREYYESIIYKGFTDINGNIYIAQISIDTQNKRLDQATLDKIVDLLEPICGTNLKTTLTGLDSNMQYSIVKIGSKADQLTKILSNLQANSQYNYLYTLDNKTKFITNLVKSVERNAGDDKLNATWTDDGKWYNEAFDGMYLVMQEATYKVGIGVPSIRTAVLDPNLCPSKSSTSAIFTKAHMSQFCLDSKSTVAQNEEDGYAGTFEGTKVYLPNLTNMFISRPFYIPNANVQDTTN